jgi:two-component system, OmpR family, sensor histidine kinase KdpD
METRQAPAWLHIYLGAFPGAGTTSAMLAEGLRLAASGVDVVVALADTRGRADLADTWDGLEIMPRRTLSRWPQPGELDVDAVLARRPAVALVDELAHANGPGSLRDKRWQDVDVLLRAGISVVTTLDVRHLAELQDAVEQITGVSQREHVPEALVLAADRIDLVDTQPSVVLRRNRSDRPGCQGLRAAQQMPGDCDQLDLLRRLARSWLEDHTQGLPGRDLGVGMASRAGPVVVALTPEGPAGQLVYRAAELAAMRRTPLVGVCVRRPDRTAARRGLDAAERELAAGRLLAEVGGRYAEVGGADVAWALARFAEREGAGVLVIGDAAARPGWRLGRGSVLSGARASGQPPRGRWVARRTLRLRAGSVEVYVVPADAGQP